jgi:hypothetical protein
VEDTGACPPRENPKKAMTSRSKRTRAGMEVVCRGVQGTTLLLVAGHREAYSTRATRGICWQMPA